MLRNRYAGSVAFEPRHASWFTEAAERLLADFAIARVAADPTSIPEAKVPGGSQSFAYYRLHGFPRMYYSEYSEEAILSFASCVQSETSGDVWCIFDNTASGAAAGNALRLMAVARDSILKLRSRT